MSVSDPAALVSLVQSGRAWTADAPTQVAAVEALVAGRVPLQDARGIPDGIKAYVEKARRGTNELLSVADADLGETDDDAAERCRRLFINWARESGLEGVRWINKADGQREAAVEEFAANEADELSRLMALIRHKHRDEPDWDPGTPDEFAVDMLSRQIQDMSMAYRTRGFLGSSWKKYAGLNAAAQGSFEGSVLRMAALAKSRMTLKAEAFNRKFEDRALPTTKEEADQLLADMFSEMLGRPVPAPDSPETGDGPDEAGAVSNQPRDRPSDGRLLSVGSDDDAMYDTIEAALADAAEGDEIAVGAGEYEASLVIDMTVTIRGSGQAETILRPSTNTEPCITVRAGQPTITALTVIGDETSEDLEAGSTDLIRVTGGNPLFEFVDVVGGTWLYVGSDTGGIVRSCTARESLRNGLFIADGASPLVEQTELWGHDLPSIWIGGPTTRPVIRGNRIHDGGENGIAVLDRASPSIEGNEIWGNAQPGIAISGLKTSPHLSGNRIHHGDGGGIIVVDGATPRVEENEVWANSQGGIVVRGSGTDPLIRANRVHDERGAGLFIIDGAAPRVEENEVWANVDVGIAVSGIGTDPVLRTNRLRDGHSAGILIVNGANPRLEQNEISGHAAFGVAIMGNGTDPILRDNRVLDGKSAGIAIAEGASPRVEDNEVSGNAQHAIAIGGARTEPAIRSNRIHDGHHNGIFVQDRASPRIEDNEVSANAGPGIAFQDPGTTGVVRGNRLHDGDTNGILVVGGASPRIEDNEIWGNGSVGIAIDGRDTAPLIRSNRIHDGGSAGILVRNEATPRVEDNELWGNAKGGIIVQSAGRGPELSTNRLLDAVPDVPKGAAPSPEPPPLRARVEGSKYLFGAHGRTAYLRDGTQLRVVVSTEDDRIGVLTDDDRWYVATLEPVPGVAGMTAANIVKVHGGKPYAYRDAEKMAAARDKR